MPDPVHHAVRVSMDVHGLAVAVVTTVVVVFALQWAEKFFIPVLLGIIIAYPLVVWLERIKIPRVAGASFVMLAVLCGGTFVTISLRGQIQTVLDQFPKAASKLSVALLSMREGQPNTMQKVQATVYRVALLGMALGGLGSAARDSHHRHCECCLPAYRRTPALG